MINCIGPRIRTSGLLLTGLLAACSKAPVPKANLRAVTTAMVASTLPAQPGARYTTTIVPAAKVELSLKVTGYVAWIDQRRGADGNLRDLEAGDVVAAGAALARLCPAEYKAHAMQADAVVKGANASQAAAKAQLLQAAVEAQRAEADWQRAQRLFQQTAITQPDYDAEKARQEVAQSRLQEAGATLSLQSSRIEDAVAQRHEISIQLQDTTLRAPFRGVILSRSVERGSLAASGEPVFVLADIDRVKLSFAVPDVALSQLHLGALLSVQIEAVRTDPFSGTVTMISPAADPHSSAFQIEVTIGNTNHRIRPGMIASVSVPSAHEANSVAIATVPLAALVHSDANSQACAVFVLRNKGGRASVHLQTVEMGPVQGNNVAILSGLRPGMKVVIQGNDDLVDGEAVSEIE